MAFLFELVRADAANFLKAQRAPEAFSCHIGFQYGQSHVSRTTCCGPRLDRFIKRSTNTKSATGGIHHQQAEIPDAVARIITKNRRDGV